ncbi:DUF4864 domain-containing protein [Sagittula sp. S175]|uniref:DUF4864 domain-containing protein n=1 Tax=Sagittula sp. S175 TaxID=3415129 RepID=UPI003C7976B6
MRFFFVLMLMVWGLGLRAEEVPREPGIEAAISDQIAAFRVDDFSTAFMFASPGIQGMFGTPDRFGAMVKNGYPMVWRPGDVRFGRLHDEDGVLWQEVLIQDQQGRRFGLAYRMERVLGEWRIAGVQVIPAPDVGV